MQDIAAKLEEVSLSLFKQGRSDLSAALLDASYVMREANWANVTANDDEQLGQEELSAAMVEMPKGRGHWLPPHNMVVNTTLLGQVNLWRFSILPFNAKNKAYSEQLGGIVIRPMWQSLNNNTYDLDAEFAKKLVDVARKQPTVQEDIRKELDWIERTFQIRVPEAVKAGLLKDALKTAQRRWGVDRLRVKNRLIPLDGSKPRDLSSFGY